MPGMYELMVIFAVVPIVIFLNIFPFWKICTKAGFPGPLSLLILVPIGNIILLFYLAFAEWPALRNSHGYGLENQL